MAAPGLAIFTPSLLTVFSAKPRSLSGLGTDSRFCTGRAHLVTVESRACEAELRGGATRMRIGGTRPRNRARVPSDRLGLLVRRILPAPRRHLPSRSH